MGNLKGSNFFDTWNIVNSFLPRALKAIFNIICSSHLKDHLRFDHQKYDTHTIYKNAVVVDWLFLFGVNKLSHLFTLTLTLFGGIQDPSSSLRRQLLDVIRLLYT